MSQTANITALAQRIRDEFNTHKGIQGALASLNTTNKASLVAAINEVVASIANQINDTVQNSTNAWSSNKVQAQIDAAVTAILGGAGVDDDTLAELAAKIATNAAADAGLVSATSAQAFNGTQQSQARSNIDAVSSTELAAVDTIADQAVTDAAAAQTTANTAVTNAATAQSAADTAQSEVDALETAVGDTTHNFVTDFTTGLN